MKDNILISIDGDYILNFDVFKAIDRNQIDSLLTFYLLNYAQKIVDANFKEYLKSHIKEKQIKLICLQYFIAVYLLVSLSTNMTSNISDGTKARLRGLIVNHNDKKNFLTDLLNFDFCLGSCGIEAQNMALKIS